MMIKNNSIICSFSLIHRFATPALPFLQLHNDEFPFHVLSHVSILQLSNFHLANSRCLSRFVNHLGNFLRIFSHFSKNKCLSHFFFHLSNILSIYYRWHDSKCLSHYTRHFWTLLKPISFEPTTQKEQNPKSLFFSILFFSLILSIFIPFFHWYTLYFYPLFRQLLLPFFQLNSENGHLPFKLFNLVQTP